MYMIQLDPVIPINVVGGPGWKGPIGYGMAIAWWQPSIEHHLVWVVFMDATGQCWEIENPYIRARANITWGRTTPDKTDKTA